MFPLARFSLLGILLVLCGCRERSPSPPTPVPTPAVASPVSVPGATTVAPTKSQLVPSEKTPKEILEKMVAAYKAATSYADHGSVRIIGKLSQPDSEPVSWPCTVAFRSPGDLRLEVNEGMLVSDGVDVFAQVRRLFGQVLKFPTPKRWTLDAIFKDVYLDEAMNLGFPKEIVAFPPQLVLLFAADPLKTFLPEGAVAELLAPQLIEQTTCDLVQVTHLDRKRIFWIDRETGALLRFDYLVEGLPLPPGVESIRLIRIEMNDAMFDAAISPDAFEMFQPEGATQVDEFRPIESMLLGQSIKDPQKIVLNRLPLKGADQTGTVSLADLSGKTVVFCFWTTWSEHSRSALAEMQKVQDTLPTDERVRFFAVNLDTPRNDSELLPMIEKTFSDWAFSIPVERPTDPAALDELGIDSFPTLCMVGPEGRVEFYFRGIVQAATLGKTVRDVLSGGKPHKEGLELFDLEKTEYRKMLVSMIENDCFALLPSSTEPSPVQTVAPLHWPSTLKLTERWTLRTLKSPGNIVELPGTDGAAPSLLLPCEGNFLALLDFDGNVVKKEKPSGLQNDELLNIVRLGVDGIGKQYIGVSSVGGRTVHVLDESLKTILSYSPNQRTDNADTTPKSEVVADFRLVDLQGNGTQALLLGILSLDGTGPATNDSLRAVDVQGQELWRDETIVSPFQVDTFSRGGRVEVFAINGKQRQGSLLRFDTQGKQLGELVVDGDQLIRWFNCADLNASGNSEIAAILVSPTDGSSVIAGLDEKGKVRWNVPLPSGDLPTPLQQLGFGDVDGDGVADWIVPAADGSIRFVDLSGKEIDSFATGRTLSGVAVVSWNNRRLIVVADPETVTAWEIDGASDFPTTSGSSESAK